MNALLNGEIDMVEIVPPDLLPLLQKDKNVKVMVVNKAGRQYDMRFNVLHKPFDNAKVRQAVLYALDQKPFLEANVGNPDYYKECKSLFPCGSPLESTKGWDDKLSGNVAKAKELLKEAGYDGTPVVLLHQTDTPATTTSPRSPSRSSRRPASRSTCSRWTGRRWWRAAPRRIRSDKGGWSAFFTSWGAPDVLNPVSAAFINASCDKATFGWPCDESIEKLRDAYRHGNRSGQAEGDRRAGPAARCSDYPTFVPLGQFTTPTAIRSNIDGLLAAPALALWNVEKK